MDKILFVAVSQSMADLARQITTAMGLDITIVVSTMYEIPDVVQRYSNIGVYISRGGTARALQQVSDKTVIAIDFSVNEVLEAFQKVLLHGVNKIAVISHPSIIGEAVQDFKIGGVDILFRPTSDDKVKELVNQLFQQGIKGVVGGRIVVDVGKSLGMTAELLESGASSIKKSINEAIQAVELLERRQRNETDRKQQIQKYSSNLSVSLEHAASTVEELSASSQELATTSQETVDISYRAYKEVDSTRNILEIVKHVAQQTNLLGLNAAIEAARVGEYGRGFSVVAQEVRALADESNKSVQNIGNMLSNLRNLVEKLMKNIDQSNEITQQQAKANQEFAQMLEQLREDGFKLISTIEKQK